MIKKDLVELLKDILKEASPKEISPIPAKYESRATWDFDLFVQIDEDKYKLLCDKGLEVDKNTMSIRKYEDVLNTGFRSSDGTFQNISEKIYSTNIPFINVVERDIVEIEERCGYGYPENKFERILLIRTPNAGGNKEFLNNLSEIQLSSLLHDKNKGGMQLHFFERKADGYSDEIWNAHIKEDNLKKYHPHHWGGDEEFLEKPTKSQKEKVNIKLFGIENKVVDIVQDAVSFTAPSFSGDNRIEEVSLYWIGRLGFWVAVRKYDSMEHNHANPWSEFHDGPYKVEGVLIEKLLEAYNVDKQYIAGRDISKIAPHELETLAPK